MSFLRNGSLHRLLLIMCAIAAFEGAAYAQFTVTITAVPTPSGTPIPNGTSSPAPSESFKVIAAVPENVTITKVVFYRNDVPYLTDTSSLYELPQDELGQDTYTYRARAYDSTGHWEDSSDFKLVFNTPRVFRMGDAIPAPSPSPQYQTYGPDQEHDHTEEVQKAVEYLDQQGGGTLLFPCTIPSYDTIAVYNIKTTIVIPSNVTLQGEGAEDYGRCRIYWNDVSVGPPWGSGCYTSPSSLSETPMFKVVGGTFRVRFKDLALYSRTLGGPNCGNRGDFNQIASENTAAIELNTDHLFGSGNITDVIVENVSIRHFNHGIRARSATTNTEISDIKIRAYRALENYRQLFIDANYAYNWDVQNLNINSMQMQTLGEVTTVQGGVEIVNAGKPASPTGENTDIKFLQLNCNGGLRADPNSFCVRVEKHGGLYFRQLHHEGVNNALIVEDISGNTTPPARINPDPIVLESSGATGKFYDASMELYLIGSSVFAPETVFVGLDSGRLRFYGDGVDSTVVDCGDVHFDVTNTNPTPSPTPSPYPSWSDVGMYHSHAERNRGSFFAEIDEDNKFTKAHTYCPEGINEVGGEYFDSGVMPTEPWLSSDIVKLYSYVLNRDTEEELCESSDGIAGCIEDLLETGGSVYIEGSLTVTRTVNLKNGNQINGAPDAVLTLDVTGAPLFQIDLPASQNRVSGIVIRNLKLEPASSSATGTGIAILGPANVVGVSSDIHFSGLTFEGFDTGFHASTGHPMIDGLSLKNSLFDNNATAVKIISDNASNWNILNLKMTSSREDSVGWDQKGGGHQSLQNVTCQGSSSEAMLDCTRLSQTGNYLAGLKTKYVTNALHIWASALARLVVRDSDFRSSSTTESRVKILGRSFIVSLNNKYDLFTVGTDEDYYQYHGYYSRLTYCGDSFEEDGIYPGLAERHPNHIVGAPTLTRVECGTRPMPWDDPVTVGGNLNDKPLVGNFYDDVREDFVIYRDGTSGVPQSKFLIKQAGGTATDPVTINWGQYEDIPLIGRFLPDSRAQIVVWRPSNGHFYVYDPKLSAPNTANYWWWHWGQEDDIPFIGNFFAESGSNITGNKDEIGVYRPGNKTFYIINPRSGQPIYRTRDADYGTNLQIGDFLGLGYDQIAQVKEGVWNIINPYTGNTYPIDPNLLPFETGDIPVAGKYLTGDCAQIGVWRPTVEPGSLEPNHSEFIIADPFCSAPNMSMIWGSDNDFFTDAQLDDIPLTINTANGSLRRPTAYRPTKGHFIHSLSAGQWWVHDPFIEP